MKTLECGNLIPIIEDLKLETKRDPKLEQLRSGMVPAFIGKEKVHYSYEADIAFYVNLALCDSTKICNSVPSSTKAANNFKLYLEARQEMSIFSHRCDHAVVVDCTSNAPIFCVETEKYFDKHFNDESENWSFDQLFDQLHDMRRCGQSRPIGALTCFNLVMNKCHTLQAYKCNGIWWSIVVW